MTSLHVGLRNDNLGKGASRKLRATGLVPGVVYGQDQAPLAVSFNALDLTNIFKQTGNRNTIVSLDVEGEVVPTLVREVQRHPVERDILHVDFYRLSDTKAVVVEVPLATTGKPAGALMGGRTRLIRRSVMVRCVPSAIPAVFEIDATLLNIGDMVRASEITLPDGVSLVAESDFNVVTCYGKAAARVGDTDDADADTESAEA